jgi:transposase-like protein
MRRLFPDWLLQPRQPAKQVFVAVVADAQLAGASTRCVDKLAQMLDVERLSKSRVSRLAKSLKRVVGQEVAVTETDVKCQLSSP